MRILFTNDDGIGAKGLRAVYDAFADLGERVVVAPDREQSAASHAISLHRPLRIKKVEDSWYSVDGTPTDCAFLAVNHIMKGARPDLLVSGINHGANLGDDVTYSGTVAAAIEGTILGVPSMAVSLTSREKADFAEAARFARDLATCVLKRPLPLGTLLNVNVPPGPVKGYRVTRQGKHSYGNEVVEHLDPRKRKYYWIGGDEARHADVPGSDCNTTLDEGLVSVTPLTLDLTHYALFDEIKSWQVGSFRRVESL